MGLTERMQKHRHEEIAAIKASTWMTTPRKGSPFRPRLRKRAEEDEEKKRKMEMEEQDRKKPFGRRYTADEPEMGYVKSALEDAKEHCEMMNLITPKRTKLHWKMGTQYTSPFEDPEPMKKFEEKRGSPAPSMTGWV